MNSISEFQPQWTSSPGETIKDILHEKNLSIDNFATIMGSNNEQIKKLLSGYVAITEDISNKLSKNIGGTPEFWLRRESQYRTVANKLRRQEEEAWLKELPISDMVKLGWLPANMANKAETCLEYFDVPNVKTWRNKYAVELAMASFRTTSAFEIQPGAVAAWIRQGELKAELIECKKWDRTAFRNALTLIKPLTKKKEPKDFLPQLIKICSDSGVAVVIVKTPSGCRASGVTKFISPDRPLLLLSFRYLTDDQFWFTFFHEAAHLILHNDRSIFIEEINNSGLVSQQEVEANDFAAEELISHELRTQLAKIPLTKRSIVGFAIQAGISPGIVIGQLQHIGRVDHKRLNTFKRRYTWDSIL